jgi:hypothetical protein
MTVVDQPQTQAGPPRTSTRHRAHPPSSAEWPAGTSKQGLSPEAGRPWAVPLASWCNPWPTTVAPSDFQVVAPTGTSIRLPGRRAKRPGHQEIQFGAYCYLSVLVTRKNEAWYSSRNGPTRPLHEHNEGRRQVAHHDPSKPAAEEAASPIW